MKKVKSKILSSILCSIMVLCLFFPIAMIFTGCGDSTSKKPSFDGMQIKDWESYSALGAGFETTTSSSRSIATAYSSVQTSSSLESNTYAKNKKQKKAKLFGRKKDGKLEEISFVDKDNNSQNQTWNVCNFKSSSLLTFVQFSSDEVEEIGSFWSNPPYDKAPLYVVDNKTGNIYDISDKFSSLTISYWSDAYNSDTSAYLIGTQFDGITSFEYVYRFSFTDNTLIIKQCVDRSIISTAFIVDKFDNIVFGTGGIYDATFSMGKIFSGYASYIYSNGEIKKFSYYVYKAINNIIYYGAEYPNYYYKFVNKNGELEDSTLSKRPPEYIQNEYLLKQVGNVSYYFEYKKDHVIFQNIYKISKHSNIDYSIERIEIYDFAEKYTFANDKLYFLKNDEVFYVDLDIYKKHTLVNNDTIIKDIYTDNQGNIIYEGINKYQDYVIGMILPDDTITESVTRNNFDVFYLQPIN